MFYGHANKAQVLLLLLSSCESTVQKDMWLLLSVTGAGITGVTDTNTVHLGASTWRENMIRK